VDQGFRENLAALFRQDYPRYEIIFVTDSADDPALELIAEARVESMGEAGPEKASTLISGRATESGQKVHNLLAALEAVHPACEVLVFVDSDARPQSDWLQNLVAPLADEQVGAATGYRWFIPARGGLSSHLLSVWNASIASALGPQREKNFCWGGSTAIRLETFNRLGMREKWRGALSDDFALMRALRAERLPIHFVPACLVASVEDCDLRGLLEFTTRQIKITRVYAPHFWKAVLAGSTLFTLGFFGGILLTIARLRLGLPVALPVALLSLIFLLGAAKSYLRLRAVAIPLARYRAELKRSAPAHLLLWPLTVIIYLYNSVAAASSRRIRWRGLRYELKSPTETVIIPGEQMRERQGAEKIRRAQ
jgi:cellulose synthase/poly-beta-1,6-N-acetylglucosamine synthase-like glycosyltransferase